MTGVLLVVSGPSGVGKSTLCMRLRQEHPSIAVSLSVTTRAPRGSEKHGVHYDFVDTDTFQTMIQEEAFVEWAEVHGNFYGTTRACVTKELDAGRDLLFDIDYQGAAGIKKVYPKAVTVMVEPPSFDELESRLRGRSTDTESVIQQRLANARGELSHAEAFDHVIVNADIDEAFSQLNCIFVRARHSADLRQAKIPLT